MFLSNSFVSAFRDLDDLLFNSSMFTLNRENGSLSLNLTLPGVKPEDLSVDVVGREIVIKYKDRSGRALSEKYIVSTLYDIDALKATYANGLLEIEIPRITPKAVTRSITFK
jgi:HSP20 family molecular chaperone IbpA